MIGAGSQAEVIAAIVAQGLPAVVEAICGLVGQRVVVLQTEPISDDPVRRMDDARAGAMRFVDDPPAPSPAAESVQPPPIAPAKLVLITINGQPHQVPRGSELTYERILELAEERDGASVTVKRRGLEGRVLTSGQSVRVEGHIVVSAIHTGNA